MSRTFIDETAETREAFLDLVRNHTVTFFEVYSGTPSAELEALFSNVPDDEQLLRFDVQKHSAVARDRFCGIDNLTRRAYKFPDAMSEVPLPCFKAFIVPFGAFGKAWTPQEVRELISDTRREKEMAQQASLIVKPRKHGPEE